MFDETLSVLTGAFRRLEDSLPSPQDLATAHGLVPRYQQPLIQHALLMKLARLVSNTSAMRRLVESGHINEQGVLQRVADETGDDILFLALGLQNGERAIHRRYLKLFWQEEFDGAADPATYKPRHMVRRSEIREYVANQSPAATSAITGSVGRMLYGVFSGYVHGASTHIFDLVDPATRRFQLEGARHAAKSLGYLRNALNYPLRALMAAVVVARAVGDGELAAKLLAHADQFQARLAGTGK